MAESGKRGVQGCWSQDGDRGLRVGETDATTVPVLSIPTPFRRRERAGERCCWTCRRAVTGPLAGGGPPAPMPMSEVAVRAALDEGVGVQASETEGPEASTRIEVANAEVEHDSGNEQSRQAPDRTVSLGT
jgi:hypothetical protein